MTFSLDKFSFERLFPGGDHFLSWNEWKEFPCWFQNAIPKELTNIILDVDASNHHGWYLADIQV